MIVNYKCNLEKLKWEMKTNWRVHLIFTSIREIDINQLEGKKHATKD